MGAGDHEGVAAVFERPGRVSPTSVQERATVAVALRELAEVRRVLLGVIAGVRLPQQHEQVSAPRQRRP